MNLCFLVMLSKTISLTKCLQHLSGPFASLSGQYELVREEEELPDPACASGCVYRKLEDTPEFTGEEFCFKVDSTLSATSTCVRETLIPTTESSNAEAEMSKATDAPSSSGPTQSIESDLIEDIFKETTSDHLDTVKMLLSEVSKNSTLAEQLEEVLFTLDGLASSASKVGERVITRSSELSCSDLSLLITIYSDVIQMINKLVRLLNKIGTSTSNQNVNEFIEIATIYYTDFLSRLQIHQNSFISLATTNKCDFTVEATTIDASSTTDSSQKSTLTDTVETATETAAPTDTSSTTDSSPKSTSTDTVETATENSRTNRYFFNNGFFTKIYFKPAICPGISPGKDGESERSNQSEHCKQCCSKSGFRSSSQSFLRYQLT